MSAIVQEKSTVGGPVTTLTVPSAVKGNLLVVFLSSTAATTPTGKDNVSGSTGWSTQATHALFAASGDTVWCMTKVAVGGETEVNPTGTGIQGLVYFEVGEVGTTYDIVVHTDNALSVSTISSPSVTTTDASDVLLGCVGGAAGSGTISAWTGTGPMKRVQPETSRVIGGSLVPGSILTGATFTANWTTAKNVGLLVVAIKGVASGALVGSSKATATAGGKAQAPGTPRGSLSATLTAFLRTPITGLRGTASAVATALGRVNAPGALRGVAAATAEMLGSLGGSASPEEEEPPDIETIGVLRGTSTSTTAAAGRAQAAGNPRGPTVSVAGALARSNASGSLRGTQSAVAAALARGNAPGALRGASSATVTVLGRLLVGVSALRGRVIATAGVAGKAQAPGGPRGLTSATAALPAARAQGGGNLTGRSAATSAARGLARAAGSLRGAWEAVVKWSARASTPNPQSSRVEITMRPTSSVNVRLRGGGEA
jgi:hypothetical protein